MNKPVAKTLLKGTIVLLIFSIFLEINLTDLENYAIFVLIWYVMLLGYIYSKESARFNFGEDRLTVKGILSVKTILYRDIELVFFKRGALQKLFDLGSVYVISKSANITIKDKIDYENLTIKIKELKDKNNLKSGSK